MAFITLQNPRRDWRWRPKTYDLVFLITPLRSALFTSFPAVVCVVLMVMFMTVLPVVAFVVGIHMALVTGRIEDISWILEITNSSWARVVDYGWPTNSHREEIYVPTDNIIRRLCVLSMEINYNSVLIIKFYRYQDPPK